MSCFYRASATALPLPYSLLVGKSSTINALLGATSSNHTAKRVAVGATPGKTKHFQTLALSDELTLCDCPGLVFPSFVTTAEEMVLNGVLPIDQMRDYTCEYLHPPQAKSTRGVRKRWRPLSLQLPTFSCHTVPAAPIRLLCQRIPRSVLQDTYGIRLPAPVRQPTVVELLDVRASCT